jgi:hypothetical protein
MASWFVQFLGIDEHQLRVGDAKEHVLHADKLTGQPAVAAVPLDFFPSDQWLIQERVEDGVVMVKITPKH